MGRGSNIKYKDEVSYVLVFKLSGFGRHAADVLATLQVMQDFGVNLIGVEDGTLLVVFMDNTNCD